jgi:hypothetical protein
MSQKFFKKSQDEPNAVAVDIPEGTFSMADLDALDSAREAAALKEFQADDDPVYSNTLTMGSAASQAAKDTPPQVKSRTSTGIAKGDSR